MRKGKKQINNFRFNVKEDSITIKKGKYSKVVNSIPDARNWVYNMSPNNDIGSDTCKKLSRWSGINKNYNL